MLELINPQIDVDAVRATLARDGIVQIKRYLTPALAERLFDCLDREVRWDLAYSRDGRGELLEWERIGKMTPAEIRTAVGSAFDFSRSRFQFAYNTFRVIDSFRAGEYPGHFLYALADALHAREHLAFARELTGCPTLQRMDVIAARYLSGHFLTLHDDVVEAEGREVAYVLNLTRAWRPEWGGLLHVADAAQHDVVRTFTPEFNSMVLFRPPLWHFVSQVASYAAQPRYTITGWMLST
jgi:Rps23 Pro-64 3,4-dihydroxylase Tpa1-like proline 4-hydroxylase